MRGSFCYTSAFVLLLGTTTLALKFFQTQTVCVKGKLTCSTSPDGHANALIKLWDKDRGPNPDDTMKVGKTDEDGFFEICGKARDPIGDIDPVFKVYTKCNNEDETDPKCYRKIRIQIPKEYINKNYSIDELDITGRQPDEERKCFDQNTAKARLEELIGGFTLDTSKIQDTLKGWFSGWKLPDVTNVKSHFENLVGQWDATFDTPPPPVKEEIEASS